MSSYSQTSNSEVANLIGGGLLGTGVNSGKQAQLKEMLTPIAGSAMTDSPIGGRFKSLGLAMQMSISSQQSEELKLLS